MRSTNWRHDLQSTGRGSGFTLLELMIVVAIIAILAGIAYPSYVQQVVKTRRADAHRSLTEMANRLERNYLNTTPASYTTDLKELGYPASTNVPSTDGMYTLAVSAGPCGDITACYTITATPAAGTIVAKSDSKCKSITLNSLGTKGSTPSGPDVCWK